MMNIIFRHKILLFAALLTILLLPLSCGKRCCSFVRLTEQGFTLEDKPFFPMMINYLIDFRRVEGRLVLSPFRGYEDPVRFESATLRELELERRAHFELIREMGFNTMRVCLDGVGTNEKGSFYFTEDDKVYLGPGRQREEVLEAIREFTAQAFSQGIRLMLLIKPPTNEFLMDYTGALLRTFRNNPAIFAYDFMNEPLYSDPYREVDKDKVKVYRLVNKWYDMIKRLAPNQLMTIGYSEPLEVFKFDPQLLPVDFISFHTYHPLRTPNEICWYSRHISRPWMIGETGLPADGDSVSYEEQRQYVREVFNQVRGCGGLGLGIWEFQEMLDSHFEANYTGLMNRQGITPVVNGQYMFKGSMKPAGRETARLVQELGNPTKRTCTPSENYYNMLGYSNLVINGRIFDRSTGQPVEGAVIRGWNEEWNIGHNTFSRKDGSFTLYSNEVFTHFELSAPGMSQLKFDTTLSYINTRGEPDEPTDLPGREREYHKTSYHPFLANPNIPDSITADHFLFDFNPSLFNRFRYSGTMGNLWLEPVIVK